MRTHQIKCAIPYFQAVADGIKTFEVRLNDRNYKPGDKIGLYEWDPDAEKHTGRWLTFTAPYILPLEPIISSEQDTAVSHGYVVLAITDLRLGWEERQRSVGIAITDKGSDAVYDRKGYSKYNERLLARDRDELPEGESVYGIEQARDHIRELREYEHNGEKPYADREFEIRITTSEVKRITV